MLVVDSYADII